MGRVRPRHIASYRNQRRRRRPYVAKVLLVCVINRMSRRNHTYQKEIQASISALKRWHRICLEYRKSAPGCSLALYEDMMSCAAAADQALQVARYDVAAQGSDGNMVYGLVSVLPIIWASQKKVLGAVSIVMSSPDRWAIMHFVKAVKSLRWSDDVLTHLVRAYASRLDAEAKLSVPDLCSDIRAWVTTGYEKVSNRVKQFNDQEVPVHLLTLYTSPREATVLEVIKRVQNKLEIAELRAGLRAWSQIIGAVGLHI